jgi:hypothetical protein
MCLLNKKARRLFLSYLPRTRRQGGDENSQRGFKPGGIQA